MLRIYRADWLANFTGNCLDASRLLRQPLCGHFLVLREMTPGNCSDTARKLPGHCQYYSPDVA
jgi:hypothetical protein